MNNQSKQAKNILEDSDEFDARIGSFQRPQVIRGALRIIKLWANQRKIRSRKARISWRFSMGNFVIMAALSSWI